jgi:hypothetical protein
MADSAAPGRSLRRIAGPTGLIALFVGVPLVLGLIWLLRAAPPTPECGVDLDDNQEAMRQAWLAGARFAFGAGALIVLAAILRVSALRRDDGPGPATVTFCILFGLYVVVCMAFRDAFAAYALVFILAILAFWATVPLLLLPTIVWLVRRPRQTRPLAFLALLGWGSLLLGVGGVAVVVAARGGGGPIFC